MKSNDNFTNWPKQSRFVNFKESFSQKGCLTFYLLGLKKKTNIIKKGKENRKSTQPNFTIEEKYFRN